MPTIPPSNFGKHFPGQWHLMYPGLLNRAYVQTLQVINGIIVQDNHATWLVLQKASYIEYLNIDHPQQSLATGQHIQGSPGGATGIIKTDDGINLKFQDTTTSGSDWSVATSFVTTTGAIVNCQINDYTPGAGAYPTLPPNASLEGSGALPQYVWITDAAATDLGVIMFCPNSYTVGLFGWGGFLNPDYQQVGDYSNITGFTGNVGIWNTGLTGLTAMGSVVIWNGVHYLSQTGVVGSAPDTDATNWGTSLPKIAGNGYIEEWDIIEYDFGINWLQYRADKRGNRYSYNYQTDVNYWDFGHTALIFFQWGNDNCIDNIVNEGLFSNINSLAFIYSNRVEQGAGISGNTFAANSSMYSNVLELQGATIADNNFGASASIYGNTLANQAGINLNTLTAAAIYGNTFTAGAFFENKTLNSGVQFYNNIIGMPINQVETYTTSIGNKRAESGFSNFECVGTIAGTVLTIPAANNYCGIINVSGAGALTINTISGIPTLFPYTLYPADGLVLILTGTPVVVAAMNDIVLPVLSFAANGTNGDWIKLQEDRTTPTPVGYSLQVDAMNFI